MSNFLPKSIRNLIEEFAKLPGIGPKSAQRLAMHLLHSPESSYKPLGEAILTLRKNVLFCGRCWNIADSNPCKICTDVERDASLICVVEEILDVVALEKTLEYKGVYHVLHGALSPVDPISPEQLKIEELIVRVKNGESSEKKTLGGNTEGIKNDPLSPSFPTVKEIILATNPSLEGEATALYIQKALAEFPVKITRIARGLPMGADIDYADEVTLGRAIKGRGEF